jgi:hypothetical protein
MSDWMDQLTEAARRQEWSVFQTRTGTWYFSKGVVTVQFAHTPVTAREWMHLVNTLHGAGLDFPDGK